MARLRRTRYGLGFAVLNRQHAHPVSARGRINLALMRELNEPPGEPLHLPGVRFPWKSGQ